MNKTPNHLSRIVGIGFGLAVTVGGMVGLGILRMPAILAQYTENPYFFIGCWIAGGLISLTGTFIYAEMSTRYPVAGGPFIYATHAFGKLPGFTVAWCDYITIAAAVASFAIAVGEYTNLLLGTHYPIGLIAGVLLMVLCVLQWQGLKVSSGVQQTISVLKALGLLVLVGACYYYFLSGKSPVAGAVSGSTSHEIPALPVIILSLRAVFYTYTGWKTPVYFAEEDTNPRKNIPAALKWGVVSVIALYVLVNLGLMAVLPLHEMATSVLPAADATQVIFGGQGKLVVTIISVLSLVGILFAYFLACPRILLAVSRAGLFFKSASAINKHQIPGNALIITTAVSIAFASIGLFKVVMAIASMMAMLVDLAVYTSIIAVRKKAPSEANFYRAPAYPVVALLMIAVTFAIIVGLFIEDTQNSIYAMVLLVAALPVYYVVAKTTRRIN
ncbi:APC family permease [Hufsiella ginkgonis]|uniref:Amino acid permease n=1 Tax=Hufsiella ginkgonis TaxID=2695274 RepID=A0A7K1XV40_9SPHI|nr:amino acid permease [Hufsiella ginkgonis]MXV14840.1 amino acid permease [Hufsiella ginkgonis]